MSLILDALNKADKERSHNDAPSITSNHDAVPPSGGSDNQKLILLASIAAILLAIAIILYLVLAPAKQQDSGQQLERAQPPITQDSRDNKLAEIQDQNPAPAETPKPRKIDTLKQRVIAAQYEQAEIEEKKSAIAIPVEDPDEELARLEKSDQEVLAIYQQEEKPKPKPVVRATPTAAPVAVIPTPKPQPTPKPRITADPSTTLAKHALMPFISDLPYSVQKAVPTIMYTRHKYFPDGDSYVRLNNVEFRPGQQVAKKVYLEEILHDGIVVRYEDRKFKMVALNSWVNM